MKEISIEGIVLKSSPIFENDYRLDVLSKEKGRCSLLAKYAQSKKYRYKGHIEPFNHLKMILFPGKSFWILKEAHIQTNTQHLRQSFNHLSIFSYCCDIIRKSTMEGQHNEPLFHLLKKALIDLKSSPTSEVQKEFETSFLTSEGLINHDRSPHHSFQKEFETYTNKHLHPPVLID